MWKHVLDHEKRFIRQKPRCCIEFKTPSFSCPSIRSCIKKDMVICSTVLVVCVRFVTLFIRSACKEITTRSVLASRASQRVLAERFTLWRAVGAFMVWVCQKILLEGCGPEYISGGMLFEIVALIVSHLF